jgi:hypothetical protein
MLPGCKLSRNTKLRNSIAELLKHCSRIHINILKHLVATYSITDTADAIMSELLREALMEYSQ